MGRHLKCAIIGSCAVALLAFAAGCAPAPESDDLGTMIEFDGGSLMYAEDDLEVEVAANPTIGYGWTSAIEGEAVALAEDEYVDLGDGTRAGEGGVQTYVYRAEGSGEAVIALSYARSWENVEPAKSVIIRATVEKGAFAHVEVDERQAE